MLSPLSFDRETLCTTLHFTKFWCSVAVSDMVTHQGLIMHVKALTEHSYVFRISLGMSHFFYLVPQKNGKSQRKFT